MWTEHIVNLQARQPKVASALQVLTERLILPLGVLPSGLLRDDGSYELMWQLGKRRVTVTVHGSHRFDWSCWNGETESLVAKRRVRVKNTSDVLEHLRLAVAKRG